MGVVSKAGINAIQLHGFEDAEFLRRLKRSTDLMVIKAVRPTDGLGPVEIKELGADAVLVDAGGPELGGTGELGDWDYSAEIGSLGKYFYLAGGLNPENVHEAVAYVHPSAVDVASGVESSPGRKDPEKVTEFIREAKRRNMNYEPDEKGYWGEYGGRFVPETLVAPLEELTTAYPSVRDDADFHAELQDLLKNYVGRPSAFVLCEKRLTEKLGGAKIYLKARGLKSHRRAQDQQLHRPDPARPANGQEANHRRNRCGPAWRRDGDGVCTVWP